uniref:Secreted protein n=1 Tax=Strongyloides papillosus TaxID=174720 RepID=A0A0N5B4N8_STREA
MKASGFLLLESSSLANLNVSSQDETDCGGSILHKTFTSISLNLIGASQHPTTFGNFNRGCSFAEDINVVIL